MPSDPNPLVSSSLLKFTPFLMPLTRCITDFDCKKNEVRRYCGEIDFKCVECRSSEHCPDGECSLGRCSNTLGKADSRMAVLAVTTSMIVGVICGVAVAASSFFLLCGGSQEPSKRVNSMEYAQIRHMEEDSMEEDPGHPNAIPLVVYKHEEEQKPVPAVRIGSPDGSDSSNDNDSWEPNLDQNEGIAGERQTLQMK